MRKKISVGVSLNEISALTVMVNGVLAFSTSVSNDFSAIEEAYSDIGCVVNLMCNIQEKTCVFACIPEEKGFDSVRDKWLSLFQKDEAHIVECENDWFKVVVSPFFKVDSLLGRDIQSALLAKSLYPEYANNFEEYSCSESFHLSRYADMIAESFVSTEDSLLRKSGKKLV